MQRRVALSTFLRSCTPTIEFPRAGNRVYNHMPCRYSNICIFVSVISCNISDLVVHSGFCYAVGFGSGSCCKARESSTENQLYCRSIAGLSVISSL